MKYLIRKKMILIKVIFLLLCNTLIANSTLKKENEIFIYIKEKSNAIERFSAKELKKNIDLFTNKKSKILIYEKRKGNENNYSFFIGIQPNKKIILKDEESRYIIENKNIYIFGKDKITKKHETDLETSVDFKNQTGTLFGVYDFLFNEFAIRWINPNDEGITLKDIDFKKLENKNYRWIPSYKFRIFRDTNWKYNFLKGKKIKMNSNFPNFFSLDKRSIQKKYLEEKLWLRKMKLGISEKIPYGHAFKNYWNKYSKTHIEWFAQDYFGFRGPSITNKMKPERMMLCISNKALQREVIRNLINKHTNHFYNASINDSKYYCHCNECKKLGDQGEKNSLTDRYVYYWNILISEIKKQDKEAKLVTYAYQNLSLPPTKVHLSKDIIIGFVPLFYQPLERIKKNLTAWNNKGLNNYFYRPNDFNDDLGFSMGNEKYIYDRFKIYQNEKLIGIDYDRNYSYSNWSTNGLAQYILARALASPNKSFKELEEEYYKTFGDSYKFIKDYYKYWRSIFYQKRLKFIQDNETFSKTVYYKNIDKFFTVKDFKKSETLLKKAINKNDNILIKKRIEKMLLANQHSLLIFKVLLSNDSNNSNNLAQFRKINKDKLNLSWPVIYKFESMPSLNLIKKDLYD